jgi:tryptophan synthase beta chain
MYALGHNFIPPPIYAGGLRHQVMSPLVSQIAVEGLVEPSAYDQIKRYEAAMIWGKTEGAVCP